MTSGSAAQADEARLEHLGQIEDLFDEYAPEFDEQLLSKLEYKVPALLRELLERHSPDRRWRRALDLGCGTGLAGAEMRELVGEHLAGVDVSAKMLARCAAERAGVYDDLERGELSAPRAARSPESATTAVAADALRASTAARRARSARRATARPTTTTSGRSRTLRAARVRGLRCSALSLEQLEVRREHEAAAVRASEAAAAAAAAARGGEGERRQPPPAAAAAGDSPTPPCAGALAEPRTPRRVRGARRWRRGGRWSRRGRDTAERRRRARAGLAAASPRRNLERRPPRRVARGSTPSWARAAVTSRAWSRSASAWRGASALGWPRRTRRDRPWRPVRAPSLTDQHGAAARKRAAAARGRRTAPSRAA